MFARSQQDGGRHERSRALAADELKLGLTEVARGLGYRPPGGTGDPESENSSGRRIMPPHMTEIAIEMLSHGRGLLDPCWAWRVIPVAQDARRDVLICHQPPPVELPVGRLIRVQIRGAEAVAVFVVTIGSRLETQARSLMARGESLEGYVLDTVGSVAVEALADVLESEIAAAIHDRGWKITNRFSPGYCTWETVGQHALFSLFADRPAGVTLGDSSLMTPIKSVSGLIGLGPDVKRRPYPCDFCSMTTCHQRLTTARL